MICINDFQKEIIILKFPYVINIWKYLFLYLKDTSFNGFIS